MRQKTFCGARTAWNGVQVRGTCNEARKTPLSPAWRIVIRAENARRPCSHLAGDEGALGVV